MPSRPSILAVLSLILFAGPCMATVHVVTLHDEFPPIHMTPNEITIFVGDSVTFTSHTVERHNVHALDDSFRCAVGCRGEGGATGNPRDYWSATVRFSRPGIVKYGCDAHPRTMSEFPATINVVDAPPGVDPDQLGLSGSWANPSTESQGFLLDVVQDFHGDGSALLFGGWFTFDTRASGGVRWYTLQGALAADRSSVDIYQTLGGRFDSAQPADSRAVGTATLGFTDCSHGALDYAFADGRSGTIPLVRLLSNTTCIDGSGNGAGDEDAAVSAWSGAWADTGNSGQGLVLEFNPLQQVMFAAWYTFGATAAVDSGAPGQAWYTLQASAPRGANALHDVAIYSSAGGVFDRHASTTTSEVGRADLVMHSCTSATLDYRFSAGANAGQAGSLDLSRITPASEACRLWP